MSSCANKKGLYLVKCWQGITFPCIVWGNLGELLSFLGLVAVSKDLVLVGSNKVDYFFSSM